jgi:hypothetical protein
MTKFKIREVKPHIFVAVVPDAYERGMLFWRAQEFYESPSRKFRGSSFSVWDYARWYSKKYEGSFSYPADFVGYNVPLEKAFSCYEVNSMETPYDEEMVGILDSLRSERSEGYLIGTESLDGSIFEHEMAHALYYTDEEYRNEMDSITRSLSDHARRSLSENLVRLWYWKGVVRDEIQAYMTTEINEEVCKGLRNRRDLHRRYRRVFRRFR